MHGRIHKIDKLELRIYQILFGCQMLKMVAERQILEDTLFQRPFYCLL